MPTSSPWRGPDRPSGDAARTTASASRGGAALVGPIPSRCFAGAGDDASTVARGPGGPAPNRRRRPHRSPDPTRRPGRPAASGTLGHGGSARCRRGRSDTPSAMPPLRRAPRASTDGRERRVAGGVRPVCDRAAPGPVDRPSAADRLAPWPAGHPAHWPPPAGATARRPPGSPLDASRPRRPSVRPRAARTPRIAGTRASRHCAARSSNGPCGAAATAADCKPIC